MGSSGSIVAQERPSEEFDHRAWLEKNGFNLDWDIQTAAPEEAEIALYLARAEGGNAACSFFSKSLYKMLETNVAPPTSPGIIQCAKDAQSHTPGDGGEPNHLDRIESAPQHSLYSSPSASTSCAVNVQKMKRVKEPITGNDSVSIASAYKAQGEIGVPTVLQRVVTLPKLSPASLAAMSVPLQSEGDRSRALLSPTRTDEMKLPQNISMFSPPSKRSRSMSESSFWLS